MYNLAIAGRLVIRHRSVQARRCRTIKGVGYHVGYHYVAFGSLFIAAVFVLLLKQRIFRLRAPNSHLIGAIELKKGNRLLKLGGAAVGSQGGFEPRCGGGG